MHSVNQVCPQNHCHEPWGKVDKGNKEVFATALEVHYPKGLREAFASAFELKLLQSGWRPPACTPSNAQAAASTGVQPTKPKMPPLVSEFKTKVCVLTSQNVEVCWPKAPIEVQNAEVLHKLPVGGNAVNSKPGRITA